MTDSIRLELMQRGRIDPKRLRIFALFRYRLAHEDEKIEKQMQAIEMTRYESSVVR